MTEANYSHVTLVIDRSGSMQDLCAEAQAGINTLLRDQFALPGKLTVTLVQFDDRIDTVTRMSTDAFGYELEPRGMTKLLDAVGGEIGRTGKDLAALDDAERPARVVRDCHGRRGELQSEILLGAGAQARQEAADEVQLAIPVSWHR
ncbi:MAG: hypothetical protein Q8M73_07985 [Actinomycetota bacterium]|nr:hypothetical protein [Actinomycetota bacterium]